MGITTVATTAPTPESTTTPTTVATTASATEPPAATGPAPSADETSGEESGCARWWLPLVILGLAAVGALCIAVFKKKSEQTD